MQIVKKSYVNLIYKNYKKTKCRKNDKIIENVNKI